MDPESTAAGRAACFFGPGSGDKNLRKNGSGDKNLRKNGSGDKNLRKNGFGDKNLCKNGSGVACRVGSSSRSLRGLCKCHLLIKTFLNFGCIDGSQSLNWSRIL